MRKDLKEIEGERLTFSATFERIGSKSGFGGYPIRTYLFLNVLDSNNVQVADHIWFTATKGLDNISLSKDDKIQFDAMVKKYQKGYKGHRDDVFSPVSTDYRLSHINKIKKIT